MEPTREHRLSLSEENSHSYSWLRFDASVIGNRGCFVISNVGKDPESPMRLTSFFLTDENAEALSKALQEWLDARRAYVEGR